MKTMTQKHPKKTTKHLKPPKRTKNDWNQFTRIEMKDRDTKKQQKKHTIP